jgi:hypothetical protein
VKPPIILLIALASLALPVIAAGMRQDSLDRPMRLVAYWYAMLAVENAVGTAWVYYIDPSSNLLFSQLVMPLEATVVLLAIAEWQVKPVLRTAVRLLIPSYWVTWALAVRYIEGPGNFSTFAGPVLALLVLASALSAFVSRLQNDLEPALESAWGWMLPGLALFFAINASATIVLAVGLARSDWPLMYNATIVRGVIYLFATLLITWGFLWPTRHRSSGDSSSPLRSR